MKRQVVKSDTISRNPPHYSPTSGPTPTATAEGSERGPPVLRGPDRKHNSYDPLSAKRSTARATSDQDREVFDPINHGS